MAKLRWVVLGLLLQIGFAHADATSQRARQRFESGTKHYDLGEYQAALDDFKEAYRLKNDPVFLYNIAQCHRLLKNDDDALLFYRNYLRRSPDAPNRAEVETRIAALQEAVDQHQAAQKATPEPPPPVAPAPVAPAPVASPAAPVAVTASPPPPRPRPIYKRWWLWTIVGGVVVVGLGVGLGVGLTAHRTTSGPFSLVSF